MESILRGGGPAAAVGPGSARSSGRPSSSQRAGIWGTLQSLEKLPLFDKAVKMAFSPPTLFLSYSGT